MTSQTALKTIQRIQEQRERFEVFCRSLSDDELSRPVPNSTWTVKDFVSHLATIDEVIGRWYEAVARGEQDETTRGPDGIPTDIDGWNERRVADLRDWPLDRILEEAAKNRERLVAALELLEDEHVAGSFRFQGDAKRPAMDFPFKLWLSGSSRHDAMHVADMLKALPERADDPDLQAWLNDPAVKWYQDAMSGPARE